MSAFFKALGRVGIVVSVAVAFVIGLASTVYLSLRSPEVKVPTILGKDRWEGEAALEDAGLNIRQRATRFSPEAKPDTILDQWPRPGDVVKAGQTVAVVVSRSAAKEGERVVSGTVGKADGEKAPEAAEKLEAKQSAVKNKDEKKRIKAANANNSNRQANENRPRVVSVRPVSANANKKSNNSNASNAGMPVVPRLNNGNSAKKGVDPAQKPVAARPGTKPNGSRPIP